MNPLGFCDQIPFLINGTVKENIIGFAIFDNTWYDEVVEATARRQDLGIFPEGDQSIIGTNGKILSNGQRQRVAMARALYARPNLYVFGDTLSGFDATTEDHVFRRVFRPDGPLRRYQATVVLFSPSVKHLASADHIVILGAKGTVLEEGSFQSLSVDQKYVHSLGVNPTIAQDVGKEIEENSIERNVGSPPKAPEPMPSAEWPRYGRIEVDGVSAGYGGKPEAHVHGKGEKHGQWLALNNIKVSIASGEKVGVCGRTGSGKAFLLLLLFLSLLEPLNSTNHSLSIDSLPLRLIDRPTPRSRLIAVPAFFAT